MKYYLFIVCWLLALCSCTDDKVEGVSMLEVKQDTVVFKNAAASQNIAVTASGEWEAKVAEDAAWCTCIVTNNGLESYLKVNVEANKGVEERWTTIAVTNGIDRKDLHICQFGSAPAILIQPSAFGNVPFEPSMRIIANVPVEVSVIDTVSWLEKTAMTTNGDTTLVELRTGVNTSLLKRETIVTVKHKDGQLTRQVSVSQLGRTNDYEVVKPDGLKGDSVLLISSGWTSSYQGGGEIAKSFDGDMNTLYHSNWSNSGANYFPITLEYKFENIDRIDYLIYYPRTNGSNGCFKEVEIWTQTQDKPTYTLFNTFDFQGSSLASRVDFPDGLQKPTGVKFVVKSGTGDGQGFASCAEMMFFQKRPLSLVFTDETCSALNKETTYEQILAMDNEFLKNIAKALYLGTYPAAQRVRSYEPYRDPDAISWEYKINPYNQLDNATGIYVKSGEELAVFVGDIPSGERIGLKVMDWKQGYSSVGSYTLQRGINKIAVTGTGLLYVMYNTENFQTAAPVKIHIATGTVNGRFNSQENTDKEWSAMLNASVAGYLDVQGEYTHMVFPVSYFKRLVSSPIKLLEAYDRMVWLEHDLMGLHKYNRPVKNRMLFHSITGDSYMYATSYRTAYHENTLDEIINVSKFKTSAIWGPAHEVGHMHQTRPGLKWIGLTEVTNNIHSQYVQTTFGNRSRLISEDMGDGATRFESAYVSTILAGIPHGKEGDVFCKLVPFWQLQLYSDKVLGDGDFYKDLHEQVRNTPDPTGADTKNGICQLNFVKMACDRLQLDLTDYFRAWGFLREIDEMIEDYATERLWVTAAQIAEVESYIAEKHYPKAPEALIYLNDDNLNCFKKDAGGGYEPMVAGQATRSGNQITVTGSKNVVAYEITQGGVLVKIFNRNTFKIVTGSVGIKALAADGTRIDVPVQ